MKTKFLLLALVLVAFTSCAPGYNMEAECLGNDPYGFWGGLWHGLISGFSFIGSLFSDDISVYAVNNTGGWYDFGFLLGVGNFGTVIKIGRELS